MSSTSVSSGNTSEENLDKEPLNDKGGSYYYCMYIMGKETLVYADNIDELLDSLIPEYKKSSEKEKIVKRIMLANIVASTLQGNFLGLLEEEANITQEQQAIFLAPKVGATAPNPTFWDSPIPLVVIDTTYEPYTSLPRPCSSNDGVVSDNLLWLRPSDPEEFLKSLSDVGYIRLMVNNNM